MTALPDTGVNLDRLLDDMVASLAAAFPALQTVEAYDPDVGEFPIPALFVNIDDMEGDPGADPGTGQLSVLAHFEAFLIVGFRAPSALRQAPAMAASIARHIHRQRWGNAVAPAEVTLIEPDEFSPGLDQFVTWRIDWQQVLHVGDSFWNDDGTLPTEVFASWAPKTGPANAGDYVDVTEGGA